MSERSESNGSTVEQCPISRKRLIIKLGYDIAIDKLFLFHPERNRKALILLRYVLKETG